MPVVENAEKMDALFVNLILLFKNAALQQMGKIMNPVTGKIDKNMEQARFSVDMLDMLKGKTRGNLPEELDRLLDSTLLELRMNYVEEAEAEAKAKVEGEAKGPEGEGQEPQETEPESEAKDTPDEPADKAAGKKPSGKGKRKGSGRGKKA